MQERKGIVITKMRCNVVVEEKNVDKGHGERGNNLTKNAFMRKRMNDH